MSLIAKFLYEIFDVNVHGLTLNLLFINLCWTKYISGFTGISVLGYSKYFVSKLVHVYSLLRVDK